MTATTKRWTDVLFSFVAVRLLLWLAVVGYVVPGWFNGPFNLAEYMDDHWHHAQDLVGRITYLEYHQIPLWNPWSCGGTFGIAEPESTFLAPDFLIRAMFFGVARGRHIVVILGVIMGLEGVYRLARKLDASAVGAAFAAVTFATQYMFITFVHDGVASFVVGFNLIPWALLCFYEGIDSLPWRLFGGFIVAWIFLCAGTYPTPYTLIVLFIATVQSSLRASFRGPPGSWRKPWASLITMGVISFLLTAAKLLPLFSFLGEHKRVWLVTETNQPQVLFAELTNHYPWVFALALVGMLFLDATAAFCVGLAALFFIVALGDFGPFAPYHFLRKLPLLGQLRNPERYTILTILFASLAAARSISRMEDALPALLRRPSTGQPVPTAFRLALVGVAAAVAATLLYPRAQEQLAQLVVAPNSIFTYEPARIYDQPFKQSRGNRRDPQVFVSANLGTLNCITGIGITQSPALRGDLPAEEFPLDPAVATVQRVKWTPNRIDLAVDATAPTRVIINQNWNKHFRASVGTVVSHEGLLAIDVPAGKHQLRVRYVDRVFDVCFVISVLTLFGLIAYAAWYVGRRVAFEARRFQSLPWWPRVL